MPIFFHLQRSSWYDIINFRINDFLLHLQHEELAMMTWEIFTSIEHLTYLGIALLIILFFLLLRKLFTKYLFALLLKLSRKLRSQFISQLFIAFERPIQWLFIIIGVYIAAKYYPYVNESHETFIRVLRAMIIFLVSWGLFNLASTSSLLFETINKKTNIHIDEILIPFLSRTLQVIIIAISISVILQEFNYEIGGFLTGLGLGGLAFSLAAKDALSNLFGGIVIITEKPFTIGDWIQTPSVEGVVEDISFRSTQVRTFAQALVTVPNATLANENITNWSEMGKRRITFHLSLSYDTPKETIERIVAKIRTLLKEHPEIHQETIFVTVDNFEPDGIAIFLYFFTKTTNWSEYLLIKEDINLKILEIIEAENGELALPTRRIYTNKLEKEIEK